MNEKRVIYIDYLRILAAFGVIILHVTMQKWEDINVSFLAWKTLTVFNCSVRWVVPVFVMISGSFFLDNDKTLDVKVLYKHKIGRIVTAFLFWTIVYVVDILMSGADWETATAILIQGNYHMWFLYMLIGLYVVVPLLRMITAKKQMTEYFLVVGFLFTVLIPQGLDYLKRIDVEFVQVVVRNVSTVLGFMEFHFTLGYVFYFVLGFYLFKYDVSVFWRRAGYVLGLLGFGALYVLTNVYSVRLGNASQEFMSNFSINVVLMAIGIFLFAKYVLSRIQLQGRMLSLVLYLSKCSFGIYLVHALVVDKFIARLDITTLILHPFSTLAMLILGVGSVSWVVSAILNRMPIVNKYIV